MSPKVVKKEAKAAPKKTVAAKSAKAPKAGKLAKGAEETVVAAEAQVDQEELEEQQAEAAANSGGGNAAALAAAAAGGTTEMSASFKNFRHHPDMESFYRFIYENDLRHEAMHIIDEMQLQKQTRKIVKGQRAQPH